MGAMSDLDIEVREIERGIPAEEMPRFRQYVQAACAGIWLNRKAIQQMTGLTDQQTAEMVVIASRLLRPEESSSFDPSAAGESQRDPQSN